MAKRRADKQAQHASHSSGANHHLPPPPRRQSNAPKMPQAPSSRRKRRQAEMTSFFAAQSRKPPSPPSQQSPPTPPPSTSSLPPPHYKFQTYISITLDIPPTSLPLNFYTPFPSLNLPPHPNPPPPHPTASPVTPHSAPFPAEKPPTPFPCPALSIPKPSSHPQPQPPRPSRLCKSRNLARRQLLQKQQPPSPPSPPETISTASSSQPSFPPPRRKRPSPTPEKDKERPLHPFFAATQLATAAAKDSRQKRPRVARVPHDAWCAAYPTVHVGCSAPALPWQTALPLCVGVDGADTDHRLGYAGLDCRVVGAVQRKGVVVTAPEGQMWAEKYKLDRRTDVISAGPTKRLVDWLRPWYADVDAGMSSSSDGESDFSMSEAIQCEERERVAVITGPIGCGKSTVVANAARMLGLNVLEVNAAVCRTGRRVREIVAEALRTHRVAGGDGIAGVVGPKTLVVFEEVDVLFDDERGFWPCLQELAASGDGRRPIVCTANAFSADMRQVFVEERAVVTRDLERLLVRCRTETALNATLFKHVGLGGRTERQMGAVLKRVVGVERAELGRDFVEAVAILCGCDTRRGVNVMHFWGMLGLVGDKGEDGEVWLGMDERLRRGLWVIAGMGGVDIGAMAFRVGSGNYVEVRKEARRTSPRKSGRTVKRKRRVERKEEEVVKGYEALGEWCVSLEVFSEADTVLHGAMENAMVEYYDDVVEGCREVVDVLNEEAALFSRRGLRFENEGDDLARVAREILADRDGRSRCGLANNCGVPCRPIFSEYLPTLRTMACNQSSDKTDSQLPRRTRASMRKGGFCGLDLSPLTLQHLKRAYLS